MAAEISEATRRLATAGDYQQFMAAYGEPLGLYRLAAARRQHEVPVMLQRNLSYIRMRRQKRRSAAASRSVPAGENYYDAGTNNGGDEGEDEETRRFAQQRLRSEAWFETFVRSRRASSAANGSNPVGLPTRTSPRRNGFVGRTGVVDEPVRAANGFSGAAAAACVAAAASASASAAAAASGAAATASAAANSTAAGASDSDAAGPATASTLTVAALNVTAVPPTAALSASAASSKSQASTDAAAAAALALPLFPAPRTIEYHWHYGPHAMLYQTEMYFGPRCPICDLNCRWIYGLLKHIQVCHERLSVTLKRDDGLWVIAVQPSQEWAAAHAQRVRRVEKADGLVMAATYRLEALEASCGKNPKDANHMRYINKAKREVCNAYEVLRSVDNFVFFCTSPPRFGLTEFMDPAALATLQCGPSGGAPPPTKRARRMATRKFYHPRTFAPLTEDDLARDVARETDDLRVFSQSLTEISDLNSGEKAFMTLWNKAVTAACFTWDLASPAMVAELSAKADAKIWLKARHLVADSQIYTFTKMFFYAHAIPLRAARLVNSAKLHLMLLARYSLITKEQMTGLLRILMTHK